MKSQFNDKLRGETTPVIKIRFQTQFKRKHAFSFTFATHRSAGDVDPTCSISTEGGDTARVHKGEGCAENAPIVPLAHAIASLSGISLGAARTVPTLLFPEVVAASSLFPVFETGYQLTPDPLFPNCHCLARESIINDAHWHPARELIYSLTGRLPETPVETRKKIYIDCKHLQIVRVLDSTYYQSYINHIAAVYHIDQWE